jgi:phosphatidylglycerol---prolipoprotein diacylglyceryl transferase
VQPEVHVLGVSIKTFGLTFALAFVAIGLLVARRLRELGKPPEWAYELTLASLLGGLVGSRLYYIVQNYDSVKHDLLGNLFSGSGLVWYGGVLGGAIAVAAWARWRGMLNLGLLDLAATPLALGYAIGRVGCQVSGDGDYGKVWHGPWAMAYPHGTVPTTHTVHPTPIYETVSMGLVAIVLWRLRDRLRPGLLFALYLVLSGTERLLVEFIRRNHHVLGDLTAPQLESIGLMAIGGAWLLVAAARGGWAARLAPAT